MTTLNGDTCPTCGYAFEIFDRGACPRCYSQRMGVRSSAPICGPWLTADLVRNARSYAIWGSIALVVATASFLATIGRI